jgi:hypothetical protein
VLPLPAEPPVDVPYSAALSFMLLWAVPEACKRGGLARKTLDTVWGLAHDRRTLDELNLPERLPEVRRALRQGEPLDP